MKKSERKKLVKRLDDLVSLYVRKRDGKCFTCGRKQNLQCGHLFSRQSYSTRWNLLNCHAQCARCNMRHEYDAYLYTARFIAKYGIEEYHLLHKKYDAVHKYSNMGLQALYDYIQELYDAL